MAKITIHQSQAVHNRKVAQELLKENVLDWTVTCAFYSALHFIDAAFMKNPKIGNVEALHSKLKRSSTLGDDAKQKTLHGFRDMLLGQKFPKIRDKFAQLRTVSENVRYLKTGDKTGFEFVTAELAKRLLQDLETIVNVVKTN